VQQGILSFWSQNSAFEKVEQSLKLSVKPQIYPALFINFKENVGSQGKCPVRERRSHAYVNLDLFSCFLPQKSRSKLGTGKGKKPLKRLGGAAPSGSFCCSRCLL